MKQRIIFLLIGYISVILLLSACAFEEGKQNENEQEIVRVIAMPHIHHADWGYIYPTSGAYGMTETWGETTFVILSDGSLWGWGQNWHGRLLTGTSQFEAQFSPIKIMDNVADVFPCRRRTAVLTIDGYLLSVGGGHFNPILDGVTHVAVHSSGSGGFLAIRSDGNLWIREGNQEPFVILEGVSKVFRSVTYAMAITIDNELWGWGDNGHGQLGNGTTEQVRPYPVKILDNVAQVYTQIYFTMALRTDNTLWAWGRNTHGQIGNGANTHQLYPVQILDRVSYVAIGDTHTMVIRDDNSLWGWRRNTNGQLGNGTNASTYYPTWIMDDVVQISVGMFHTAAIRSDGSLWMWGSNNAGQLGNGTTTTSYVPIHIMDGVAYVYAVDSRTLVITDDGRLLTWGGGILGDGIHPDERIEIGVPVEILFVEGD